MDFDNYVASGSSSEDGNEDGDDDNDDDDDDDDDVEKKRNAYKSLVAAAKEKQHDKSQEMTVTWNAGATHSWASGLEREGQRERERE